MRQSKKLLIFFGFLKDMIDLDFAYLYNKWGVFLLEKVNLSHRIRADCSYSEKVVQ
jgi:hypothetical protein